jgi:hypothetical protein
MPLAGPAVLVTALAPDALTLRERVDWALSQVILDGRFVLGGRAFIFRQTGGGSMSQTARSPAAAATASGCPAPSVRW